MIRKAIPGDFDFVYEMYMHPLINPFLLYEEMDQQDFKPVFNDLIKREVLFVFDEDSIPTGMCKLVPQQHRNAHVLYLGGVAVHPFFCRKRRRNKNDAGHH